MTTFRASRTAAVFPRTRTAAQYALQHATSDITWARAGQLLHELTRCETMLATGQRQPTPDGYGLLRVLVLTVRDLAGRAWLDANADDPAIAAFTALYAASAPPDPGRLDQTLAGVIWARFAPHGITPGKHPAQDTTAAAGQPAARPVGSKPAGTGEGSPPVTYGEFLAAVRDRGEYATRGEAEQVTRAVLEILAARLPRGQAAGLAAQLPGPLAEVVQANGPRQPQTYGVEGFLLRVAERLGARPRTAEWDASAVLSTLADAISGEQLSQLISQLPSGYALLFGQPGPG